MDLGLRDKAVFVSGASRGIGFAIARAFAVQGARAILVARDAEATRAAAAEIGDAFAIAADMTDPGQVKRAFAEGLAWAGSIEAVVANVGSGASRRGWDLDPDDWQAALATNLLGTVALARTALEHLVPRGEGSITFVSSIAGLEAIGAPVAYAAAKSGLQGAAKSLSRLVGPAGVRVNVVAPGNILFPGGRWEELLRSDRDAIEESIEREVPLARFGRPEEVADAVCFLASDRASFITGATLVVDGGQSRAIS